MSDDPNVDPKLAAAAQYAGMSPETLGMLSTIPYQHPNGVTGTFADLVPQQLPPPPISTTDATPAQYGALASIPLQNPEGRGQNITGTMANLLPEQQGKLGINPAAFEGSGTPSPNMLGSLASIPLQHNFGNVGTMADLAPRYQAPRWAPPRTRLIDLLGEPWKSAIEGSAG